MIFSLEFIGSLREDLESATREVKAQIPFALHYVGAEMRERLQEKARTVWYDGYTPLNYDRRTDTGEGIALADSRTMQIDVDEDSLSFTYEPVSNQWIPPDEDVSGDHLINIIQTGTGGFWISPKGEKRVPPRPYWNEFIADMENDGIISAFIAGMEPFTVVKDGRDVFDLSDFKLLEDD